MRLPLVGRSIPIVADAYADPEKGTGAVKITPAHDFNDWEVGKRAGLPAINVMDTRARIDLSADPAFRDGIDPSDDLADLDKLDRYEARDVIVTIAEEQGWLDGIDEELHTVPHGDRSKVAIEPFLTDQWYVDAATLAKPALAAVRDGRTRILPEQHEKTYFHWLENIEPWCISRQLWWGHQIPVWYGDYLDEKGEALHSAKAAPPAGESTSTRSMAAGSRAFCGVGEDAVREEAETVSLARRAARHRPLRGRAPRTRPASSPRSGGTIFVTLAATPTSSTPGSPPASGRSAPSAGPRTPPSSALLPDLVLVTGFDIIFFWVARMMMMQLELTGEVPFRDVYIHALVRDEKGKKMSKSLGNILDPIELIDKYGADAVRFTLAAMAAMGRDLKLSEDRIAGYRNFGTKLWNAARFAEMNDCRPDPAFDPTAVTLTANKWIVGETGRAARGARRGAGRLPVQRRRERALRPRLGQGLRLVRRAGEAALRRRRRAAETRATMAWVLDQCLILMHPVMPFITEALWGQIAARPKLLCHADWPGYGRSSSTPRPTPR